MLKIGDILYTFETIDNKVNGTLEIYQITGFASESEEVGIRNVVFAINLLNSQHYLLFPPELIDGFGAYKFAGRQIFYSTNFDIISDIYEKCLLGTVVDSN